LAEDQTHRRVPKRSRGQQRVDLILDAAADLIAAAGYETLTTNGIAAHAGISIGSLYQYFPHKDAVVRALADRYLAQWQRLEQAAFSIKGAAVLPLPELLDRSITPLVNFQLANPAFSRLFMGSEVSAELAAATAQLDREAVEQIRLLIQVSVPGIDETRARLMAVVSKSVVKTMIAALEHTHDPAWRESLRREFMALLLAYLERPAAG
jgi:AcrR family transcriptional regulator